MHYFFRCWLDPGASSNHSSVCRLTPAGTVGMGVCQQVPCATCGPGVRWCGVGAACAPVEVSWQNSEVLACSGYGYDRKAAFPSVACASRRSGDPPWCHSDASRQSILNSLAFERQSSLELPNFVETLGRIQRWPELWFPISQSSFFCSETCCPLRILTGVPIEDKNEVGFKADKWVGVMGVKVSRGEEARPRSG